MIKDAIQKLSKKYYVTGRAAVLSVNKTNATCNVRTLMDDVVLLNVALKPIQNTGNDTLMGYVPYPAIGSVVLVSFVDNDPADAFVLQCSRLQGAAFNFGQGLQFTIPANGTPQLNANKLTFNGGSNNGMVLLMPLLQAINDLQNRYNDLLTAFTAHTHLVSGSPSDPTTQPAPARLKPTRKKDLENTQILQ